MGIKLMKKHEEDDGRWGVSFDKLDEDDGRWT